MFLVTFSPAGLSVGSGVLASPVLTVESSASSFTSVSFALHIGLGKCRFTVITWKWTIQ